VPHPSGSEAVQISFPADLSLHVGVSAEAHQRDKLEQPRSVPLPLRLTASGVGKAPGTDSERHRQL